MTSISNHFYTKEITSYIKELISFDDAKDFDSLDDFHKDKLVALGIAACNGDVEIILNQKALSALLKHFKDYQGGYQHDIVTAVEESAHEYFADVFNDMIAEELAHRYSSSMHDAGLYSYQDRNTGETVWRKM